MSDWGIAERIQHLRKARGETQTDLANVIDLDPDRLSKALHGKRRFTSLELALIAEHYGVTVPYLLDYCPECYARKQVAR